MLKKDNPGQQTCRFMDQMTIMEQRGTQPVMGVTQAGAWLELEERKQPNQRGLEQEGDNIPSEVWQQRDSGKATQPLSEPHPEGRDKRQPAPAESSSGKKEAAPPVEELQPEAQREHREQDTRGQR